MRPMTLFETRQSNGNISLAELFAGEPARSSGGGLTSPELAEEIARGGWPGLRSLTVEQSSRAVHDYLDEIDTRRAGRPATLGVIVGTGYGYVRKESAPSPP